MKVLTLCSVVAILLVFGLARSIHNSRSLAQDSSLPGVVNETEAFVVESLTAGDNVNSGRSVRYILKLKNVSAKKITAYMVEYPSKVKLSEDFASVDGGIAPGEVKIIEIHDAVRLATSDQPPKITIKLAMFEDGSSEGDFGDHKSIADARLGMQIELERINDILHKALASKRGEAGESEVNKKKWLEQVIADIQESPETSPSSAGMKSGFHYARESTLILLRGLNEWQDVRQTDSIKANRILTSDAVIAGTSDLSEGVTKIARFNETLIGRYKRGSSNEK